MDAAGFFIWVSPARPGSIWDGNALVGEVLLTHLLPALPAGYYIICDGGYRALSRMLCPFKKPAHGNITPAQEHFNYLHSLTRGIVEKCFGKCRLAEFAVTTHTLTHTPSILYRALASTVRLLARRYSQGQVQVDAAWRADGQHYDVL